VLRGEDHLSNTPRQLLIAQALGLRAPQYGHLSLLTGADGAPLSKRQGAQTLRELREAGVLPLAIVNQLYRLGHSGGSDGLHDLATLAREFDTARLVRPRVSILCSSRPGRRPRCMRCPWPMRSSGCDRCCRRGSIRPPRRRSRP
jgi:glutamyl/glutaminyl-tRNA synthetase